MQHNDMLPHLKALSTAVEQEEQCMPVTETCQRPHIVATGQLAKWQKRYLLRHIESACGPAYRCCRSRAGTAPIAAAQQRLQLESAHIRLSLWHDIRPVLKRKLTRPATALSRVIATAGHAHKRDMEPQTVP